MADTLEIPSKKRDSEITQAQKYGEAGLDNPDALLQNLKGEVAFQRIEADLAELQKKVDVGRPSLESDRMKANEKKYLQIGDNEGVFLEYFPKKNGDEIAIVFYLTLQVAGKTYSVDVTKLIEEGKFSEFLASLSAKLNLKEHVIIAPDLNKIKEEVAATSVSGNASVVQQDSEDVSFTENPGAWVKQQFASFKDAVTGLLGYGTAALSMAAFLPAILKKFSGKESEEMTNREKGVARAKGKLSEVTGLITGVLNGESVTTMTPVSTDDTAATETATNNENIESVQGGVAYKNTQEQYALVGDEESNEVQRGDINMQEVENNLDFTHYPAAKNFYSTYLKQFNDIPYINKRGLSYTHMNVGNVKKAKYFCEILDKIGIPYAIGRNATDGGRFLAFYTYGHGMLAQFLMLNQFYRNRDLEWGLLAYSGGLSESPTSVDNTGKKIPGMGVRYKRGKGNRYGYNLVNGNIAGVTETTTFGELSTQQMRQLMKLIRTRESGLGQELLNINTGVA